jgi:hypothetical protein
MFRNLIFHTLKGKNGLSLLDLKRIDVSRVKDMTCRERVFCIMDKEYPFVLTIEYAYNFFDRRENVRFYEEDFSDLNNETITKRYKTEDEVNQEISEIIKKQDHLAELAKDQNNFYKLYILKKK